MEAFIKFAVKNGFQLSRSTDKDDASQSERDDPAQFEVDVEPMYDVLGRKLATFLSLQTLKRTNE